MIYKSLAPINLLCNIAKLKSKIKLVLSIVNFYQAFYNNIIKIIYLLKRFNEVMVMKRKVSCLLTIIFMLLISMNSSKPFNAVGILVSDSSGVIEEVLEPVLDSGMLGLTGDSNITLPSSVDLSASDCFPCVRDQGELNSCVGWATTYYQFGYQVAAMNGW